MRFELLDLIGTENIFHTDMVGEHLKSEDKLALKRFYK